MVETATKSILVYPTRSLVNAK